MSETDLNPDHVQMPPDDDEEPEPEDVATREEDAEADEALS
jgi:hypothetical protein